MPDLIITSVDIIDVKNDLQSAVSKWRPVMVRINTDEGISGFGMAKDLAKSVLGIDSFKSEAIWNKMQTKTFCAHGYGTGAVVCAGMSAIDIALWDIKGKALGVPCYQLLGGKTRDKVRTYASQLQFC